MGEGERTWGRARSRVGTGARLDMDVGSRATVRARGRRREGVCNRACATGRGQVGEGKRAWARKWARGRERGRGRKGVCGQERERGWEGEREQARGRWQDGKMARRQDGECEWGRVGRGRERGEGESRARAGRHAESGARVERG